MTLKFYEHHQQTEQSLFSHLAHNLPVVLSLTLGKNHFSTAFRGELYDVLRRLATERTPFEKRMIHRYLENRGIVVEQDWHEIFSYIGEDVPGDPELVRHYANNLIDISMRRDYTLWLEQHKDDAENMRHPMIDTLQQHAQVLAETQGKLTQDIAPDAKAIWDREQQMLHSPYFDSGLQAIDANVRGLKPGHIWVIAGGYKGRKTTVALNIVANVLRQDKHVMYIALEDDDVSFFNSLTAIWGDIPFAHVDLEPHLVGQDVKDAKTEIIDTNLRIYDSRKGVHNWKLLKSMVQADKLRYGGVDLVVIDYIQAYSSRYEDLQQIVPMLQALAGEEQVALLILSQMNNADLATQTERIRNQDSMLHTKSTGDLGALCHVGIEIFRKPEEIYELMINIKVARKGVPQRTFSEINPVSGKLYNNSISAAKLVDWETLGIGDSPY